MAIEHPADQATGMSIAIRSDDPSRRYSTTSFSERSDGVEAEHRYTTDHSSRAMATQEQDDALHYYARSMLRAEHERRSQQLDRDQQLEIDNLMFLLSRDAKEKCEGVLGVAMTDASTPEANSREADGKVGRVWKGQLVTMILAALALCALMAVLLLWYASD